MNIRNNISYSCKKAVPKPCPLRSFPGSLPRWRRDHLLFNMSDHLLFTLSGDGLCDVACVLLLKPDICLVCYAVVVVRTTSLCLSLQQIDVHVCLVCYAVVVVRTASLCLSLQQADSTTAKIRSEVLSPFRTVRMFFYLAFIASGGLGGLIAISRLIAALRNAPNSDLAPEILKGLGIDLAAVALFAFLYARDLKAQNAQLAKLSREETLANLKLEVNGKKVVPISKLRGFARLIIVAGPAAFIEEAFRISDPFTKDLLDRGVRVVYFATDGLVPNLQALNANSNSIDEKDDEQLSSISRRKSLWQLTPIYTSEWSKWLNEQKSLANVAKEKPVYISLRMDGRVRGSGVGYPPWNAFVAQLPPLKGIWSGVLDGMDGRI